jgi:GMP synthase-like glutamine amidotransferase
MRFLVFQHIACEHPGLLGRLMREQGIVWDTVELDEGETIPSLDGYDALLVFGGPMNVDEEERFPWLRDEVEAIRAAAGRDLPYLGFCLGAQLLAKALGARVTEASEPEIGIMPVTLTTAGRSDPLLVGLAPAPLVFQWHADTFAVPCGATLLASSAVCPNQAFRHGRACGLQFHLEVTPDMVRAWSDVPEYRASLERRRGPGAAEALLEETEGHVKALEEACSIVFQNFLGLVSRA